MKHTVHMRDREMGKVGIMLMVQGGVLGKLRHSAACLRVLRGWFGENIVLGREWVL